MVNLTPLNSKYHPSFFKLFIDQQCDSSLKYKDLKENLWYMIVGNYE